MKGGRTFGDEQDDLNMKAFANICPERLHIISQMIDVSEEKENPKNAAE